MNEPIIPNMKRTIIIMAKVPAPGTVKTRLQPALTPKQSADFAACLLRDAINKAAGERCRLVIAYSPAGRADFFEEFSDHDLVLIPQNGDDLGERMANAFKFAFSQNADSAVMIGTDSPTFSKDFFEIAFEKLHDSDAVMGRSEDGGFYLIGLRTLHDSIFNGVEWSSGSEFEQTARNIRSAGLNLGEAPAWYDVDTLDDLERLRIELKNFPDRAPATARWLKEYDEDRS